VQAHSSALFLKDEMQRHIKEEEMDSDANDEVFPTQTRSRNGIPIRSKDGSFTREVVPGDECFGFGSTFFANNNAEYVVRVEAKRIRKEDDQADLKMRKEADIHQNLIDESSNWAEYEERSAGCCRKSKPDIVTFEGRIPIDGMVNEVFSREKRDDSMARLLDRQAAACQASRNIDYLEEGALAPIFVDVNNDAQMQEAVSFVNPCSQQSAKFPPVDTTPISRRRVPVSIANSDYQANVTREVDVKYRKTKYSSTAGNYREECWSIPGHCGGANQDVGTVWAKKVMSPKLKADRAKASKGGKDPLQDTAPSLLLQS
jgi:hypothetical protein